jgi:hypothetical protein
MTMHSDDARHYRIAAQVEDGDIGPLWLVCSLPDRRDLATFDRDVLISRWRRSRAVDDPDVLEDYFGRPDAEVFAHLRPETIDSLRIREF